jgi:hypothetical protein
MKMIPLALLAAFFFCIQGQACKAHRRMEGRKGAQTLNKTAWLGCSARELQQLVCLALPYEPVWPQTIGQFSDWMLDAVCPMAALEFMLQGIPAVPPQQSDTCPLALTTTIDLLPAVPGPYRLQAWKGKSKDWQYSRHYVMVVIFPWLSTCLLPSRSFLVVRIVPFHPAQRRVREKLRSSHVLLWRASPAAFLLRNGGRSGASLIACVVPRQELLRLGQHAFQGHR